MQLHLYSRSDCNNDRHCCDCEWYCKLCSRSYTVLWIASCIKLHSGSDRAGELYGYGHHQREYPMVIPTAVGVLTGSSLLKVVSTTTVAPTLTTPCWCDDDNPYCSICDTDDETECLASNLLSGDPYTASYFSYPFGQLQILAGGAAGAWAVIPDAVQGGEVTFAQDPNDELNRLRSCFNGGANQAISPVNANGDGLVWYTIPNGVGGNTVYVGLSAPTNATIVSLGVVDLEY